MDKIMASADAAIHDIGDGSTIMLGGFGLCGIPENLIAALVRKDVKDLTVISGNAGLDNFGLGALLQKRQVKKCICSYLGDNKLLEQLALRGEVELELVPQGTFSERIRAGGAGIPAFFTPTGIGTVVADGKEIREFYGRMYVMERALRAPFALVKGWKGDRWGNVIFRKTARNFNPMMAAAADVTIAEVEDVVQVGDIPSDQVHLPGVYVKRIVRGEIYERRVERRLVRAAQA